MDLWNKKKYNQNALHEKIQYLNVSWKFTHIIDFTDSRPFNLNNFITLEENFTYFKNKIGKWFLMIKHDYKILCELHFSGYISS